MNKKIVAVVLAHNEENHLPISLGILTTLKRRGLISNIVVVNDGSTDRTAGIAKKFKVAVVSHKENLGLRQGFISGTLKAHELGATHLLLMDADLIKFPENSLRQLLRVVDKGYSMVLPEIRERSKKGTEKKVVFNKKDSFALCPFESSIGPRLIVMTALEPLTNPNHPLHKKWIYLLTAKNTGRNSWLGKYAHLLSPQIIAEEKQTSQRATRWGLATALNSLIENFVSAKNSSIYFDRAFRSQMDNRRVNREQKTAKAIVMRAKQVWERFQRRKK
jgi:glycosyltransferase involved in cell wall biosynthesis